MIRRFGSMMLSQPMKVANVETRISRRCSQWQQMTVTHPRS